MAHQLVDQLRSVRGEWRRALADVSEEDGGRRLPPMNSIGWMVGHLAWHERRYWLERAQGIDLAPELDAVAQGAPGTTPSIGAMWSAWRRVTEAADPYLDRLTTEDLTRHLLVDGRPWPASVGTMLQRVIYHYWVHIGESLAVRQLLGHRNLPEFPGPVEGLAPYRPESTED